MAELNRKRCGQNGVEILCVNEESEEEGICFYKKQCDFQNH